MFSKFEHSMQNYTLQRKPINSDIFQVLVQYNNTVFIYFWLVVSIKLKFCSGHTEIKLYMFDMHDSNQKFSDPITALFKKTKKKPKKKPNVYLTDNNQWNQWLPEVSLFLLSSSSFSRFNMPPHLRWTFSSFLTFSVQTLLQRNRSCRSLAAMFVLVQEQMKKKK